MSETARLIILPVAFGLAIGATIANRLQHNEIKDLRDRIVTLEAAAPTVEATAP